jgi:8-oxo-dGTP pyrophosphatase MutT (NUDIX family)
VHRNTLLSEIEAYSVKRPLESEVSTSFYNFVSENPDCFKRELLIGHVTASAFIVDLEAEKVLLLHHKKLDRWLQPGGHCDGETDTLEITKKEVSEETGIVFSGFNREIFDLDIHTIPERKGIPEHLHYDVRYLFEVDSQIPFEANEESNDLKWIDFSDLKNYTSEVSILRMLEKI